MSLKEHVIIVAGGKGSRMQSSIPKQFIVLHGKPILLHTVEAFLRYSENINIVLVLPESDFTTWQNIAEEFSFNKPITLQKGGASRFQSVKNGLSKIEGDGLVAIHDGVRPLVSTDIINASFRLAEVHNSAVASVSLKESIRSFDPSESQGNVATKALDRTRFRLIQTPQTFRVSVIKKAYETEENETLTDDASVAERAGVNINLFEGSYRNIKITTQEDLILAEALLKSDNR